MGKIITALPAAYAAGANGGIMENINFGIACDVNMCRYNHDGCNCTLDKIQVGSTHNSEQCTCCRSYIEK